MYLPLAQMMIILKQINEIFNAILLNVHCEIKHNLIF